MATLNLGGRLDFPEFDSVGELNFSLPEDRRNSLNGAELSGEEVLTPILTPQTAPIPSDQPSATPPVEGSPITNELQTSRFNPGIFIFDDGLPLATYDKPQHSFSSGLGQFFVLKRSEIEEAEEEEGEEDEKAAQVSTEEEGEKAPEPPILKRGSEGEDVKKLQQRLKDLGYDVGPVDGIFGPLTEGALKEFQTKTGLAADGTTTPQTYSKLYVGPTNQSPEKDNLTAPEAVAPKEVEETGTANVQAPLNDFRLNILPASNIRELLSAQGADMLDISLDGYGYVRDNGSGDSEVIVANQEGSYSTYTVSDKYKFESYNVLDPTQSQLLANYVDAQSTGFYSKDLLRNTQQQPATAKVLESIKSKTEEELLTPFTPPGTAITDRASIAFNYISSIEKLSPNLPVSYDFNLIQEGNGEEQIVLEPGISPPNEPATVPRTYRVTSNGLADPVEASPDVLIPAEWKFTVAPGSISWSKTGNVNREAPLGTNRQLLYYTSTTLRTLSLGECALEGFTIGRNVENKVKQLERCIDVFRDPRGFLSPYVWELFGIGKSYGYYIITNITINEVMRDDRGSATRITFSMELEEVPKYQVYDGRDLNRSNTTAEANFCIGNDSSSSPPSPSGSGTQATQGAIADSASYAVKQSGEDVASWYDCVKPGECSKHKIMANGILFDPEKFTVAHKELPFGTCVRFTSPRTGKSVIAEVTDRGPYIEGRVWDLSRASARAIGLDAEGVGTVKWEILDVECKSS